MLAVVLDVDTGVDDALALIFAVRSPALRVRGVTCVYGNTGVDRVVDNTLRVLSVLGAVVPMSAGGRVSVPAPVSVPVAVAAAVPALVPVARGAARPLSGDIRPRRRVHGRDGMGDLGLPPPNVAAGPVPAADLLTGAGTVLALGPLTTLAGLGRERLGRIGHLVISGGTRGRDPNLEADPEAAAVVLAAVPRVTAYGPVFADVPIRRTDAEALLASPDPGARLAGRLAEYRLDRFGGEAATLGDAGAVAAVIRPDLLRTRRGELYGVEVELAEAVDGEAARRLFLETLAPRG
jgi:pyrimidine-specific ribonucleoside hydrolase